MKKLFTILLMVLLVCTINVHADLPIKVTNNGITVTVENAENMTVYVMYDTKPFPKPNPIRMATLYLMIRETAHEEYTMYSNNQNIYLDRPTLYTILICKDYKPVFVKQIKLDEIKTDLGVISKTIATPRYNDYYLKSEDHIEVDDEQIQTLAKEIVKDTSNPTKAIYDWVVTNIEYDYSKLSDAKIGKGEYGAVHALTNKKGICYDMATLYTALCRANDIISTVVAGTYDNQSHAWSLVRVNDTWISVDLSLKQYDFKDDKHVLLGEYRLYK